LAGGFSVTEHILANPDRVWGHLTDFNNAQKWMPGIDRMTLADGDELETGSIITFNARGNDRETRVTALERGKRLALTSTQGGVTATYEYLLAAASGGTDITLNASCKATGFWKLLHPLIILAMKKADSPQLANLKALAEQSE
jgi:carbon monoxide dehydrogenase subunit G